MRKLALTTAMVFMIMAGANQASAEMVDIGTGQMEPSEFVALKAMVQGRPSDNAPTVVTHLENPDRYGLVEMSHADYESLRDKVAGHSDAGDAPHAMKVVVQKVNIGTGEMPIDEFLELKRMVSRADGFIFGHLAAIQP